MTGKSKQPHPRATHPGSHYALTYLRHVRQWIIIATVGKGETRQELKRRAESMASASRYPPHGPITIVTHSAYWGNDGRSKYRKHKNADVIALRDYLAANGYRV